MFKVGDEVEVVCLEAGNIHGFHRTLGKTGVIVNIEVRRYGPLLAVEFEEDWGGLWNCDRLIPSGLGLYINASGCAPVNTDRPPHWKVIRKIKQLDANWHSSQSKKGDKHVSTNGKLE